MRVLDEILLESMITEDNFKAMAEDFSMIDFFIEEDKLTNYEEDDDE